MTFLWGRVNILGKSRMSLKNKKRWAESAAHQNQFYHNIRGLSIDFPTFVHTSLIFYTLYITSKIIYEIFEKVFTFHNKCAILKVQEGEDPDISNSIVDILGDGGIPRFVFHTKGSSRMRAGKTV